MSSPSNSAAASPSSQPKSPQKPPPIPRHPPLSQQPVLSKTPLVLSKTPPVIPKTPPDHKPAPPIRHPATMRGPLAAAVFRAGGAAAVAENKTGAATPTALSPASIRPDDNNNAPFNTKQVIDEANIDTFATVTTKMKDMVSLLRHASDDDKTLVLFELQQVLEFARDFVLYNILPVVCAHAADWSEAVQVPAAEALSAVLASAVPPEAAKCISNVACTVIGKAKDKGNRELWGEVLVCALPHGSWSGAELDNVVQHLRTGNDKFSITNKLTARILGSMAVSSVDHETKKLLMHRAIAMTQDKDEEVRGIIADSMGHIGAALSVREVELNQWDSIQRLSHDENARVHAACLRTISVITKAHKPKSPTSNLFRHLLPPVFSRECVLLRRAAAQDVRTMDEDMFLIVEINSEVFGNMLTSCYEYMPDDAARKEVYKAFQSMSTCNSPVIRKNCAHNMPEVAQCLHDKFGMFLVDIIDYLSQDADDETRWTLASRLHEALVHLANRESISQLFRAVLMLLRDKNWLVRQNLMQNFQSVVAELSKYCTYNSSGKMSALFEQLQLLCDGNWRVQELLVKQLQLAAPLVPPASMTGNVLPLLYRISREGTYLVRKSAMGSIATSIRYIPDPVDRDRFMRAFCEEWARGRIYWMRIGFIDAAKVAVGLYSRCLFRDSFGLEVLRLAYDAVSNVRLRMGMLMPAIAPACYQMEEFQTAKEALKKDPVPDVREVAMELENEIEKSLKAGKAKFEDDMSLEDEERELYSRHLHNQKEANKKKNLKKKATVGWFSGKANRGSQSTQSSPARADEEPAGSAMSRMMSMPLRKSGSVNRTHDDASPVEEFHSADWERSDVEPLYNSNALPGSKDDSALEGVRSFKGLRHFKSGRTANTNVKKSSWVKK